MTAAWLHPSDSPDGIRCKPQGNPVTSMKWNEKKLTQTNFEVACVNKLETSWTGTTNVRYQYGNKWYPGAAAPPVESLNLFQPAGQAVS